MMKLKTTVVGYRHLRDIADVPLYFRIPELVDSHYDSVISYII